MKTGTRVLERSLACHPLAGLIWTLDLALGVTWRSVSVVIPVKYLIFYLLYSPKKVFQIVDEYRKTGLTTDK